MSTIFIFFKHIDIKVNINVLFFKLLLVNSFYYGPSTMM